MDAESLAGEMASMLSMVERHYRAAHEAARTDGAFQDPSREAGLAAMAAAGARYRPVYTQLSAHPGQEVCELGFGDNGRLLALASLCSRLTVVDIVDRTDGLPLPDNATAVLHDLNEGFPFADGMFDTVIAMMVIEHLFDPFHAFRESARVCRSGGTVIVNLPNVASIRCRLELLAGRMPVTSSSGWFERRSWDGGHLHGFTVRDTCRLATLYGLRLRALVPVGRFLWLKRLRPSLFCHEVSYVFVKT